MPTDAAPPTPSRLLQPLGWFLLGSVIFSLAYTQAPLYYSNQNQYFVHGLARGGLGHLSEDWLAKTKDPTPIFSGLVAFTYRYLDPNLFYIYYALLMGVYFVSLVGVFSAVAGPRRSPVLLWTFVAVFVLLHSALLRYASVQLLGVDYPWYFQAGVAGQYLLGDMFQPSTFGVLLLLAVYLFVTDRPMLAVTCSSLGAVLHATYLLGAAALTLGFLLGLVLQGRGRKALLAGGWALLLVAPMVVYHAWTFAPTDRRTFAAAQDILVHFRIPHHAIPRLWADWVALAQVAWIALGVFLSRNTRLYPAMLIPFLAAALLTLVQIATDSDTLALLFPWRISVYLMPLATTVILSRLLLAFTASSPESPAPNTEPRTPNTEHRTPAGFLLALDTAVIAAAVLGGVWIMATGRGYQAGDEELGALNYVRRHAEPGDLYLIPVPVPELEANTRGSRASSFIPLRRKRGDSRLIPVDLQKFRLYTGVPIYVDFKSIPYKDEEVVAWRERVEANEKFYGRMQRQPCRTWLPELRELGVTHILTTRADPVRCDGLKEVYADEYYRVYEVTGEG